MRAHLDRVVLRGVNHLRELQGAGASSRLDTTVFRLNSVYDPPLGADAERWRARSTH